MNICGLARAACLTFAAMVAIVPAASSQPVAVPATSAASVQLILAEIRRAVGFGALARLAPGLSIVDRRADGQSTTLSLGVRRGEYRIGDETGFDGRYRWQTDSRRRIAIPNALRQHDKAAWPLWVRGHWWLNPASGISAALIPAETDATRIALSLRHAGGVVPATLYIDRATMLPERLVVPYDRGPFEARFSDWQAFRGVRIARRVESRYRDESTVRTERVARLAGPSFAPPPATADTAFDPAVPALLAVRRGPNFGSGERGHSFVQARVDGVDAGWWLLDSGSDGMLIDEALADRLGMPVLGESRSVGADGRPRRATFRRGRSFTLGRLTYRDPVFLALDLSGASAPPGEHRSGVIGYDAFARAVIEYARDGDEVAVCDPAAYRPAASPGWQPLDFIDQTPAVPARIEGNLTGLFQIDTGAAGSVDFYRPFVEANRLLDGRETREIDSEGAGGAFRMRAGRIGWIELGGIRFRDEEAGFRLTAGRDGAGVIGRALLRPFRTVFDYPHRRLAFVPASRGGSAARSCR
jgi:hypothetical protein